MKKENDDKVVSKITIEIRGSEVDVQSEGRKSKEEEIDEVTEELSLSERVELLPAICGNIIAIIKHGAIVLFLLYFFYLLLTQ